MNARGGTLNGCVTLRRLIAIVLVTDRETFVSWYISEGEPFCTDVIFCGK